MYPYNFPLAPPPGYEYDDGYDGAGPPPAPPPSGPTLPSQPLPGHLLPTPAPAPPPPQPLRPLMYPPEYPYPYYPYVPVYQYPMAPPVEEPVAALNYKPIQTKRNVKPRINKIEGSHPGPAHASQSTAHASHASHATPGGSTTRGHGQGAAPAPSPPAPAAAPARLPGEVVTDAIFNHLLAELGISRPVGDTVTLSYQLKLKNPLEFQLFEYFTTTLLPALDLYLPHPLFGRVVPDLALYDDTNMLLHLVLCVLLVAHARRTPDPLSVPLRYYHQAIQLIRHQLAAPGVEQLSHGVIARCLLLTVFLCIYEMFFVAVDLTYVRGALTILLLILARKPRGVLAELPLYYACFVVILACDAYRGLLCDAPPMFSVPRFWAPLDPQFFARLADPGADPGSWQLAPGSWQLARLLLLLLAATELRWRPGCLSQPEHQANQPLAEWRRLVARTDAVVRASVPPTIYTWASDQRYPVVYFGLATAAMAWINVQVVRVLLYETLATRPPRDDGLVDHELAQYLGDYAGRVCREVVGVVRTYEGNRALWQALVHCLRFVAARLDPDEAQELLAAVEAALGLF